jgi:hypothetical protein
VQDSVIKTKCEIKTAEIVSITKKEPASYDLLIVLDNGDTLCASQNNEVAELDNHSTLNVPPMLKDIIKPIDAKIYATRPDTVKNYLVGKSVNNLESIFTYIDALQKEQVKLAGIKMLGGMLKHKKIEEVTTAVVVV